MKHLALLRGINVGGNNIVDMKKLKSSFERLGFTRVLTYINSGNIIFEESLKTPEIITGEIENAILQDFQLNIKVLIRSFDNIEEICSKIPEHWLKNEQMRTDVMFLWEKYDSPDVLAQLKINPVDHVLYLPGAIVWNVEGVNYSQSGMMKLMGTDLYRHMTIRNINTVRKLHQMMSTL